MLFHIRMDVNIPAALPQEQAAAIKAREKAYSQELQASGKWRHLWRLAGQYSNISIFDTDSVEELHALISALPLFPFMKIEVMPLCRHPSSIRSNDI